MSDIRKQLENLSEDELQEVREYIVENFKDIITEMAFDRKVVISKIRGLAFPVIEHLIKVIRYKDDINLNKHIKDIETWLNDIQRPDVGKAGKKLKSNDYFKLLFEEPVTDINNIQFIKNTEKGSLKKYQSLEKIKDEKETMELLYKIVKEISIKLSQNEAWWLSDFIRDFLVK